MKEFTILFYAKRCACLICIAMVFYINAFSSISEQDSTKQKRNLVKTIDSLHIDKDINHWSVRLNGIFKDNNFKLKNEDYTLQYVPTNRFGLGVGFATSKVVVDLNLSLKINKEEPTKRFDFQTDLFFKRNLIFIKLQDYKGFNVTNISIDDPGSFRMDIRMFSVSFSYLRLLNSDLHHLTSVFSGVNRYDRSVGSFLLGGYNAYHLMQADSSIVPESSENLFNEWARIENFNKFSIGVIGGYNYLWSLPSNFFVMIAGIPGVGISFRNIDTSDLSYSPSNLFEFYLHTYISIGYNGDRFYIVLRNENEWNFSSLDYGNTGSTNASKVRLTFAWKIRSKK